MKTKENNNQNKIVDIAREEKTYLLHMWEGEEWQQTTDQKQEAIICGV